MKPNASTPPANPSPPRLRGSKSTRAPSGRASLSVEWSCVLHLSETNYRYSRPLRSDLPPVVTSPNSTESDRRTVSIRGHLGQDGHGTSVWPALVACA